MKPNIKKYLILAFLSLLLAFWPAADRAVIGRYSSSPTPTALASSYPFTAAEVNELIAKICKGKPVSHYYASYDLFSIAQFYEIIAPCLCNQ